jgi:2-dehydropantoate 2-reductase
MERFGSSEWQGRSLVCISREPALVRIVILGAGAIGGTIGARLHQHGHDVVLIARGAHGDVIRSRGLTFVSPQEQVTLRIPVFSRPSELSWREDDVVVVAVKSQDTAVAARDLAAAAGQVPVFSAQNGVANERTLSRWFVQVHGICVMMPTEHIEPGTVIAHSAATTGILDVGQFPGGHNQLDQELSAALQASRFESRPLPDVMRWKYRKLLTNLGNAVQALCGDGRETPEGRDVLALLRAEADTTLAAAGIEAVSKAEDDERRGDHLRITGISGHFRGGGSTWQSLARGSDVETDYLNGEIALLGRLHGVPTPANASVQALMAHAAATKAEPGSMSAAALLSDLEG